MMRISDGYFSGVFQGSVQCYSGDHTVYIYILTNLKPSQGLVSPFDDHCTTELVNIHVFIGEKCNDSSTEKHLFDMIK